MAILAYLDAFSKGASLWLAVPVPGSGWKPATSNGNLELTQAESAHVGRGGRVGLFVLSQSTHKRVVVRKMDKEVLRGYVNPQSFLKPDGIEMLSVAGQVVFLPYKEVKGVYFVRDFDGDREHLERKVFSARPKSDGLWLRMKFKDNEILDGILPNNLLLLTEKGFTVIPPDPYANNQRIYVPKSSLAELTVLGVIGNPLKQKKRAAAQEQIRLFNE